MGQYQVHTGSIYTRTGLIDLMMNTYLSPGGGEKLSSIQVNE
jgi:hypothetical protein